MATPLKGQRGYIVEVQGFSAGHGQAAIQTSQKMADSVVRYLVLNHEIPVYRIYVVGMGNAPLPNPQEGAKSKRITGGRVEVSLLKNDLEQLASNSGSSSNSGTSAAPASTTPASAAPASSSTPESAPASSTPQTAPATPQTAPTTPQSAPAPPQQPQSPQQ